VVAIVVCLRAVFTGVLRETVWKVAGRVASRVSC
jgi:hypothetical protein